jgi:hypothetical protein
MVAAVLIVIVNFLPLCSEAPFLQVAAAAVVLGSAVLVKRNENKRHGSKFLDSPAKFKIFVLWPLLVYFVFLVHIFLFYIVD